jgi:ABC-type phosphate/phosphonate transport system permease subunit
MIKKLAKLVAYKKAPKTTYVLRHPVKGTKALVAAKGAKALVTGRTGLALGAVAAVPLGLWAASRIASG